jgi:hypothetical protein
MKKVQVFIAVMVLLMLSGCADSVSFSDAATMTPVGFWYGWWHGYIALISWVVSLFDDSVAVYAIYNNGCWYDFGFLSGVGLFFIWHLFM